MLADAGVSIVDVTHDRIFGGDEVAAVSVECTVETMDHAHIGRLLERLTAAGFSTTLQETGTTPNAGSQQHPAAQIVNG